MRMSIDVSKDAAVRPVVGRKNFLLFSPPTVGEEEIAEVVDTLRSGWITTGPKTKRFETEFTSWLGAPASLALNSCTAGLHTALVASGVGPGDEVITTAMTFVSTVHVIEQVGARPVLVDVEDDTLNIDPAAVERAITPRTRAILAVHYAGHPAELDQLRTLAAMHDLTLIEDAAHALPARYRGQWIGAGPNLTAFSFYATKNLTTGEGGMLTGAPVLIDRARVLSLHGMNRDAWRRYERAGSWRYDVTDAGFKYNMTDIAAAIGLVQLRRLDGFHRRRRAIAAAYTGIFSTVGALEPPTERAKVDHAWHLYVLRLQPGALRIGRDEFIEALAARNIGTSVHFIPIYHHAFYRRKYQWRAVDFPVAERNFERVLSLPLHPNLSDADVADVIETVLDVVRVYRR